MGKTCVICGKPSGMYPLCREHLQMKAEGKVIKCEDCGTWHIVNTPCDCKKSKAQKDFEVVEAAMKKRENAISDEEEISTECIICRQPSNGYWFCKDCYRLYKNKEIHLRIKNCSDVDLLDDSYEGVYICADGHIVKSKSERDIDNYLFYHDIFHVYEKAFPIDDNPEHDLHPDFYLPKLDVYIEHWGYDESNVKYTEAKKYKLQKYKEFGITLICTHEKTDAKDIDTALDRKLKLYKKGQITGEE